jgi:hypothetical protein
MPDVFNTISSSDWAISTKTGRQHYEDMKLFFSILALGAAKLSASDDLFFLQAISAVESGDCDTAVGPCGAVGRFQMLPTTWAQHTDWPVSDATKRLRAEIVALRHLQWLKKAMDTDVYWSLAAGWKSGAYYNRKTETNEQMLARIDYANRVVSLFKELKNK